MLFSLLNYCVVCMYRIDYEGALYSIIITKFQYLFSLESNH